jgi:hypothetical protein
MRVVYIDGFYAPLKKPKPQNKHIIDKERISKIMLNNEKKWKEGDGYVNGFFIPEAIRVRAYKQDLRFVEQACADASDAVTRLKFGTALGLVFHRAQSD